MSALFETGQLVPVILGAILALVGGLTTQFLFLWVSRSHARKVLLLALKSELGVLRENIGNSVEGIRISLRQGEISRPNVFSSPTPVFDANAGNLGNIRKSDLVEHIVEVYSVLHALRERSNFYAQFPNESLKLQDLNTIHLFATAAHMQVIKLHSRLLNKNISKPTYRDNVEAESSTLLAEFHKQVSAGNLDAILNKDWKAT